MQKKYDNLSLQSLSDSQQQIIVPSAIRKIIIMQGNKQENTICVIYKPLKEALSLIRDIIISQMNKYMDINVEPGINSIVFICSE